MTTDLESFSADTWDGRVRAANARRVLDDRRFVLYWMIAARRPDFNLALDRAIAWSRLLGRPLIVLEALRVDYPWASDRLHRFILDGMAANAAAFRKTPATYYPYVEPLPGAAHGLLERFARDTCVIVTDEFPCFFLPETVRRAATLLDVRVETVDSNGILPLHSADRAFAAAVHYRRFVQKRLRSALLTWPRRQPFKGVRLAGATVPPDIRERWPRATKALLEGNRASLATLPIDHDVPMAAMTGGFRSGRSALSRFVARRLDRYHDLHDRPDDEGTSRLSPYLHFGHVSAHEIFDAVMKHERWSARRLPIKASGLREGWWRVGPGAEAFLEQLIVWRELAFNTCVMRPDDYDRYDSLPEWALTTLRAHEDDPRPHVYTREQLERAETHDPVWNAAQRELRRRGWFHNYMRMLWGKKILEWSRSPREALETMIAIMNRWSLDGRDPNSYAGYFWTLGRYDRPWPERPIFGKVRSMSSERTVRKVRLKKYLQQHGAG